MVFLLLSRPGGPPPSPWFFLLMPVFLLGITGITNKMMGMDAMYKEWPADRNDPIEENAGWQQVEFGPTRGHCPMSIKFGKRCLHLKQPFPFQPLYWRGPASIPWNEVLIEKEPGTSWWAFLRTAEFRLGRSGRVVRLRGKAARTLLAEVKRRSGQGPNAHGPVPPVVVQPGPGPIKPK